MVMRQRIVLATSNYGTSLSEDLFKNLERSHQPFRGAIDHASKNRFEHLVANSANCQQETKQKRNKFDSARKILYHRLLGFHFLMPRVRMTG